MDKGSPQGPDPLPLGSHGWFLTRIVLCLLKKTDNLESVGANESYGSGAGKISELAAMSRKLPDAEAIRVLPTKVNVAVAAALASIGPDAMGAKITSVEGFAGDDHCITMETDGLKVTSDVYSRTAEIAGWSIVSLLQNLAGPVVLF